MNVKELLEAGQLDEAVQAAQAEVRRSPSDVTHRSLLAELLCFTDLERADVQLETIGRQDPQAMLGVSLFRQLIRAETARRQFYKDGRLPEFLGGVVPPRLQLHLQASIAVREGRLAEAGDLLQQAESQRPAVPGTCQGEAFDDLRDLDDLTASFFEVLTSTGKYYWVPMETVVELEFRPPARPRDLLWRAARMVVHGGPDGEVFLPVLYAGSEAETDNRIRLGRYSDWRGGEDEPVRGIGCRCFLVGDQDRSILELASMTFPSSEASG
jgi:type VI secretion system protein ImpE